MTRRSLLAWVVAVIGAEYLSVGLPREPEALERLMKRRAGASEP